MIKVIKKFFCRSGDNHEQDSFRRKIVYMGIEANRRRVSSIEEYKDQMAELYLGEDREWSELGSAQKNEALSLFREGLHHGN